jgi:hypothetical protein
MCLPGTTTGLIIDTGIQGKELLSMKAHVKILELLEKAFSFIYLTQPTNKAGPSLHLSRFLLSTTTLVQALSSPRFLY